jgi:DtxR family Mn-dependent transcriptional regulator
MSEAVERKLLTLLGNPTVSPFGNPIPGLDALGGETSAVLDSLTLLSTTATPEGRRVEIKRISEQLQEDNELMRQLAAQGLRPGMTAVAQLTAGNGQPGRQRAAGGVAQHVFVSALDEELTPGRGRRPASEQGPRPPHHSQARGEPPDGAAPGRGRGPCRGATLPRLLPWAR